MVTSLWLSARSNLTAIALARAWRRVFYWQHDVLQVVSHQQVVQTVTECSQVTEPFKLELSCWMYPYKPWLCGSFEAEAGLQAGSAGCWDLWDHKMARIMAYSCNMFQKDPKVLMYQITFDIFWSLLHTFTIQNTQSLSHATEPLFFLAPLPWRCRAPAAFRISSQADWWKRRRCRSFVTRQIFSSQVGEVVSNFIFYKPDLFFTEVPIYRFAFSWMGPCSGFNRGGCL